MAERPQAVSAWLEKLDQPQRQQAEALATTVHAANKSVVEAVKWRRLTFTVNDNWHHWLCAVAVAKDGAKLVFHKGALLDDPKHLLQGDNRYLRQIAYDQVTEHPDAVQALVQSAIKHQTDMLEGES